MNKFVYFIAVGFAFAALQVATVEANHDRAHVDEMRAMEDSARQTMRETEDSARQTMRETEDNERQAARDAEDTARQAARDQEDSELQQAEEAMNTAAGGGAGADPCMGITPQADQDACYAASLTGGQHDCSEIPDAEGRALCETAEARGTPPTEAECAQLPTDEGRNRCMEHVGGTMDCADPTHATMPECTGAP